MYICEKWNTIDVYNKKQIWMAYIEKAMKL